MVNADVPIRNEFDDLLNRNKFARSLAKTIFNYTSNEPLTIAIMGEWGSGKTSIINLFLDFTYKELDQNGILKDIKYKQSRIKSRSDELKEHIIIKFNPWFFSNQSNLYVQFFKVLIENIVNHEYEKIPLFERTTYHQKSLFKKLKIETLEEYLDHLELNKFLPRDGKTYSIDSIQMESYDSLMVHKKLCDEYFNSKNYKIIVIIDDIDRLYDNEIKQVFTLVKSLADFPNLIYILSFCENQVNRALKDWNNDDSEDFINKIIQVPLTVPKFSGDLFEIFKYKFNNVLNNHAIDKKDFNIHKLYLWLYPFFKNIRDINRFCNALDFYLYSIGKEIWIYDFALITSLQIFEKDIYDEIKDNKDLLTGDLEVFEVIHDAMDIINGNLNGFLEVLFGNGDFKNQITIKNILSDLFPKVNYVLNSSYTPSSEISIKKEHCGIMEEEYFDLYFTFDNVNSLSKSRIDSVIQSANKDIKNLRIDLISIKDNGFLDSLINQLPHHFERFIQDGIKNLIRVFIESYDELFNDEPFNSQNSKISKAINLIYCLLKEHRIDEESFFVVINNCENNYFKICLIWELGNVKLLNDESMLKVTENISRYLSEYFEKTEFSKIEHIRSNIWFWKEFSSFENTNEYVSNLDDEDLVNFISEYVWKNLFQNKYEIKYGELGEIVDLSYIKKRFEKIKNSDNGFEKEKMNVVGLFLDDYVE